MKATVLVVDDHAMFRDGVRRLLERNDFDVIGEAGNGKEAMALVREKSPEVVIMDITMPDVDGISATEGIMASNPETKVIALSIHGGKRFVERMLRAGAAGYVLKDSVPEQLVEAVHWVLKGKTYLSPAITGLVVAQYVDLLAGVQAKGVPGKITDQEQIYIQLIGEGCSSEEIAVRLEMDEAAVHSLEQSVLTKFQFSKRSELVEFAGAQKWFMGQDGIEAAIQKAINSTKRRTNKKPQPLIEPLTNREFEVLELLARRFHDKEIADQLSVSVATVKTHISHILQKLGVSNRRAAAEKARAMGLIE